MFWDKDKILCEESWVDLFSVLIVSTVRGDTQKWMVSGVYGPSSDNRREVFLVDLSWNL